MRVVAIDGEVAGTLENDVTIDSDRCARDDDLTLIAVERERAATLGNRIADALLRAREHLFQRTTSARAPATASARATLAIHTDHLAAPAERYAAEHADLEVGQKVAHLTSSDREQPPTVSL